MTVVLRITAVFVYASHLHVAKPAKDMISPHRSVCGGFVLLADRHHWKVVTPATALAESSIVVLTAALWHECSLVKAAPQSPNRQPLLWADLAAAEKRRCAISHCQ
jgi:hypothetical protein